MTIFWSGPTSKHLKCVTAKVSCRPPMSGYLKAVWPDFVGAFLRTFLKAFPGPRGRPDLKNATKKSGQTAFRCPRCVHVGKGRWRPGKSIPRSTGKAGRSPGRFSCIKYHLISIQFSAAPAPLPSIQFSPPPPGWIWKEGGRGCRTSVQNQSKSY